MKIRKKKKKKRTVCMCKAFVSHFYDRGTTQDLLKLIKSHRALPAL